VGRSFWTVALLLTLTVGRSAAQSTADDRSAGEALYLQSCAACHGPRGEGGRAPTLAVPQLPRARTVEMIARVIREGLGEMPRSRLDAAEARQVADWVQSLGRRPVENVPGDAGLGERIFFGKGGCTLCHAIQKKGGGALGPDLSDIGLHRGGAHLRESLLEPGADVPKGRGMYRFDGLPQNFLAVRLRTRDGRSIDGVRVNEDTFTIQVRDASAFHSFLKSELTELHKDWGRSPMPAYGKVLSTEELDALVAFLAAQRGTRE
jgi:cytochrome c oxidase cbb3-type subunit III